MSEAVLLRQGNKPFQSERKQTSRFVGEKQTISIGRNKPFRSERKQAVFIGRNKPFQSEINKPF